MTRSTPARILLIDHDPDLAHLEQFVLEEAGYRVDLLPPHADPILQAQQTNPAVIVIDIPVPNSRGWEIVDKIEANPRTRAIPVRLMGRAAINGGSASEHVAIVC